MADGVPVVFADTPATRDFYEDVGHRRRAPPARYDRHRALKQPDPTRRERLSDTPAARLARQAPWVLELGCGWGSGHYWGIERGLGIDLSAAMLAERARRLPQAGAIVADAARLPIRDASVPFVLTVAFLEHVPRPEAVLAEVARVLAPGGVACHADAWFCRRWARLGLHALSWRNATAAEKAWKLAAAVLDWMPLRAATIVPRRAARELRDALRHGPAPLPFGRLAPNYELGLLIDEDAAVSLDPHAILQWYRSRGFEPLEARTLRQRLLFRAAPVLVRKPA